MKYVGLAFSAIGGALVVYGIEHEKMWYILGLSFITGAVRMMMERCEK